MTDRLQSFGYVEVTFARDCLLGIAGTTARGHSFHYSSVESSSDTLGRAYELHYLRSHTKEAEGFVLRGILASYAHIHFQSHPELAKTLIQHACQRRRANLEDEARKATLAAHNSPSDQ
jgi:cobyrinic acid a,c-diamide synthase